MSSVLSKSTELLQKTIRNCRTIADANENLIKFFTFENGVPKNSTLNVAAARVRKRIAWTQGNDPQRLFGMHRLAGRIQIASSLRFASTAALD